MHQTHKPAAESSLSTLLLQPPHTRSAPTCTPRLFSSAMASKALLASPSSSRLARSITRRRSSSAAWLWTNWT